MFFMETCFSVLLKLAETVCANPSTSQRRVDARESVDVRLPCQPTSRFSLILKLAETVVDDPKVGRQEDHRLGQSKTCNI